MDPNASNDDSQAAQGLLFLLAVFYVIIKRCCFSVFFVEGAYRWIDTGSRCLAKSPIGNSEGARSTRSCGGYFKNYGRNAESYCGLPRGKAQGRRRAQTGGFPQGEKVFVSWMGGIATISLCDLYALK